MARAPLGGDDPSRVGRYRLTARLGAGGMGVVYLGAARDGGQVAVKVLRAELADDPEFRIRFGHEVASLMRVQGVCTVRVIEADTDAPRPFMVTEYAAGPSLAEYIDAHGPLGTDMLYGLATGLAEALTAIHAAGVVHRDLKPSNVILAQGGPKVIDFGIARALDATAVTRTGMMVGSAGFMAPEQVTGQAGQAADIFAWAVTIAYAAGGRAPFGTGEGHAILYRILHGAPDIAAVPERLRPPVEAALAKDPGSRPTADELLDQLTRLSAQAGSSSDTTAQAVLAQTWPASNPSASDSSASDPSASDPSASGHGFDRRSRPGGSLLLEPGRPDARRPGTGRDLTRGLVSRHAAPIGVSAIAVVAVAALVTGLLMGHVLRFGQLTASQRASQVTAPAALGTYPGQRQRGVFQTVNRVVASGRTIVAMGSQTSDDMVRQQFFVSADGGVSWHLAPLHAAGGGQPSLGHPAALLAGGAGGWLAVGPQAIWTSQDGLSWTLAATHGISPQLPGDSVWVITKTAGGFLAAGKGSDAGGATQAVIWTSPDGVTWQRMTAAQLALAGTGESVLNISHATYLGDDTVISGQVTAGGATYSGAWRSTDGGSTWTRVAIPADHGAGGMISGLAFDGSGLIAVRAGRSASGAADGVSYFSPNGLMWQYSGTLDPAGGWSPAVVKGSEYGFVVTGQTASGQIAAYTSSYAGPGTASWRAAGSLGAAASEFVASATVAPGGTVVAVGSTAASKVSQQPVFLEVSTAGGVRQVPPGGTVPELAVNGTAVAGGEQVAVGSADGYPAVWRTTTAGSWALVSSLSLVSGYPGLTALTSVIHGSAGWLAVGVPGPVVLTSADGKTWRRAGGAIERHLGPVSSVAVAAGPAGYTVVGRPAGPDSASVADVWSSRNLTSWTQAKDMNLTSGSTQVVAVAADQHGFVSAGSHDNQPAVWTTTNGLLWTTIVLGLPADATSAVLNQIAIKGDRVVALGHETKAGGTVPLAELSADGGASWQQVPFSPPGPDAAITALTADSAGFTAAGQFGSPDGLAAMAWTSRNGTTWTPAEINGLSSGGTHQITALASSGPIVTGIGVIDTEQSQQPVILTLPGS